MRSSTGSSVLEVFKALLGAGEAGGASDHVVHLACSVAYTTATSSQASQSLVTVPGVGISVMNMPYIAMPLTPHVCTAVTQ